MQGQTGKGARQELGAVFWGVRITRAFLSQRQEAEEGRHFVWKQRVTWKVKGQENKQREFASNCGDGTRG